MAPLNGDVRKQKITTGGGRPVSPVDKTIVREKMEILETLDKPGFHFNLVKTLRRKISLKLLI